jgi:NitT/TauT family transport system substrate-binding protein
VSASEAEGCAFKSRRAQILSGLLAALVLPGRAGAQTLATLEVAGPPNDTGGLLFYAADMGFYEKAGLRVRVTSLANSGSISSAIASGSVQIGSFAVSVGALAHEKGLPLVMIAPAGLYLSSAPTSGLIVPKNSPIRKASDLNGKTIATRDISNMSYFGAKQWIDKNGGDSKSIHWIEIPDTGDVPALESGRIDAASVSEPALDDALRSGEIRSLAPVFDAIGKRFLISGYFTSEDFAKAHPDVVRKFAGVMSVTARWANGNRARSGQILEKYAQATVLPGSTRITYAERLSAADVQPVLDLLLKYGLLKAPMRAKDMFSSLVPSQ